MRKAVALGLALLLSAAVADVWAAPLTLKQCVGLAVHDSPLLAGGIYDTEAARYEVDKQRGLLLPDTTGQLSVDELKGSPTTPFSVLNVPVPEENGGLSRQSTQNRRLPFVNWGLVGEQAATMNYPLFQNGSILGFNDAPAVAGAKAALSQAEVVLLIDREKAATEAAAAFLYAVWYRQQSKIESAKVSYSEQRLEIIKSQVALGLKSPEQIVLANQQLEADRQSLLSATQSTAEAASRVAVLIGRTAGESLDLDESEPARPQLPRLDVFLRRVMPVHPALQVQNAKIEVARQNYELARSAMLPTVGLQTSYGVAEDLDHFRGGEFHPRPTLFLAVLQVSVPILDFGQRQSAAKEAFNQIGSARAARRQAELDVRAAITNAYSALHSIDSILAGLQYSYATVDYTARLTRARRKLGMAEELGLIDAEYALLNAREAIGLQRLQLWLELATLQNVSGGVWQLLQ